MNADPRSLPIALDPRDWYVATWRRLPPLPAPPVEPFDLGRCANRLARVPKAGAAADWDRANLSPVMSVEEARFWLEAMTQLAYNSTTVALATHLKRHPDLRPLSRTEIAGRLRRISPHAPPEIVIPLARLLSLEDIVSLTLSAGRSELYQGLRYLVPYLEESRRDELREVIRPYFEEVRGTITRTWHPPAALLAARVGMHRELEDIISTWRDDSFADRAHSGSQVHNLLFGLGSTDAVRHQMKRLGLHLVADDNVRGWLAHTGLDDLEMIRDSVLACSNQTRANNVLSGLILVESPLAAPLMLELKLTSRAPRLPSRWLEADPARTAEGLAPLAGGRGKLADAAVEVLRDLVRAGHAEIVQRFQESASRVQTALTAAEEAIPRHDDESTPTWLARMVQEQLGERPARLPVWIIPEQLPELVVEGRALNRRQINGVIAALRQSTLDRAAPLVTLLCQHIAARAREAFARALFERWLTEGAPAKERWAMEVLAHWGGDRSAVELAWLVRRWPGEKQHPRAKHGLAVLKAIGTDTALLELHGIAQKVRFRGLQQLATGFMMDIASRRGLTTAQLEDRIVPTLGLDERGSRWLDFGPRKFRVVLGPDLKPVLLDEGGKVRASPPKPGAKDDAALARQAQEQWKLLGKQLKQVAGVQASRLEQALVAERKWAGEEFRTYLVAHPVLGLLTRRLLWEGRDGQGRRTLFRVTEDRDAVDAEERLIDLAGQANVALTHPVRMSADERRTWQQVFTDHEIIQPFAQLARRVNNLETNERQARSLTRCDGTKIPTGMLMGVLTKTGWDCGATNSSGLVIRHVKYFPQGNVCAVICYKPGAYPGSYSQQEQELTACYFVPGVSETESRAAVQLEQVDAVVMSEVLSVLHVLSRKQ